MRPLRATWMIVCGALVVGTAAGRGTAQQFPVVAGKKVVATVQGEPITLDEFNQWVAAMKREQGPGAGADRSAELALLDRMIDMVVMVQEARRMEMDKLPEIRQMIDSHARVTLREELVERVLQGVRADPGDVQRKYQASVREWKVSAALFDKEEHARSMAAEIGAGRGFSEAAKAYLADGRATKAEDGVFLRGAAMDPALAQAVAAMAVGSTSSIIRTRSGLVILKLEGIRDPDHPAARAAAEQALLAEKRKEAVRLLDEALKKKYVKINERLLASLDYESETPGLEGLLKDRRVLAEIQGEKPVTVGELTGELKFQFFHGPQKAVERKKLNARKAQVLDAVLHRKVFRKEALRLKLDRTDAYKGKVKEYESSTLFGAVLRKAIAPDVKLKEDEVKAYYDAHRGEYTTPEMMRIDSLVFSRRASAETALESLRKGADFQWVAGRATEQVDPNTKGLLSFGGRPIMTSELPGGVQKAVAGAGSGDVRLYASPESHFYVLVIRQVHAAQPKPYEQVRAEMVEKVLAGKFQTAVKEYATRLRSLSDIKVYLKAS